MRLFLLCILLVSSAQAATLSGSPITVAPEGVPDTLLHSSFVCDDATILINTKEITLAKFADRDNSEVLAQLSSGACDVIETETPVVILRMVRVYFTGIEGTTAADILLQINIKGRLMWTESLNLLESRDLYEAAKARMNDGLN